MEVILLEKIGRLGNLGDRVSVKPGYARNFLFPRSKAVLATKENLEVFEERCAERERHLAETLEAAKIRVSKLNSLETVTIASKVGRGGRLFGSIGTRDIANALTQSGIKVDRSEVRLPEGVLRSIGEYNVDIQVHSEMITTIKVVIAE